MLMRVSDEMLMLRLPPTLEQIVSGPVSVVGRVAVFVLLLLLPGVSGWAQSATPQPVASASVTPADWGVFAKNGCATCHRARGMGDGAGGSDLGRIRSGTGFFEIAAVMWNHGAQMGGATGAAGVRSATFAGTELPDIVAYIFAAGRDPRGEAAPEDPADHERPAKPPA